MINCLMPFKEILAFYTEKHMTPIIQNAQLLIIEAGRTYLSIGFKAITALEGSLLSSQVSITVSYPDPHPVSHTYSKHIEKKIKMSLLKYSTIDSKIKLFVMPTIYYSRSAILELSATADHFTGARRTRGPPS
jgi:hypothetical protein